MCTNEYISATQSKPHLFAGTFFSVNQVNSIVPKRGTHDLEALSCCLSFACATCRLDGSQSSVDDYDFTNNICKILQIDNQPCNTYPYKPSCKRTLLWRLERPLLKRQWLWRNSYFVASHSHRWSPIFLITINQQPQLSTDTKPYGSSLHIIENASSAFSVSDLTTYWQVNRRQTAGNTKHVLLTWYPLRMPSMLRDTEIVPCKYYSTHTCVRVPWYESETKAKKSAETERLLAIK